MRERNRLCVVLLNVLDICSFNNLAKIKEIPVVVTHLYSAVELLSTYHLVDKEKVAEQHNKIL